MTLLRTLSMSIELIGIAAMKGSEFLEIFIEGPPNQLPASSSVDQVARSVDARIEEILANPAADEAARQ